jgi:hypothetical protein
MTGFTTHFEDDAWQSFVRGILPASKKHAMQSHLDRGCAECQKSYGTWRQLGETASREESVATADSADSFTKTVFALLRSVPFRAGLALLAEPVFDSFQDPAPVGIRGAAAAPRQLVYEAGGYLIDLQLEQYTAGAGALTGQVVHAWTEGATRGSGVVLLRDDSVVGQAITNSIGEFQLDCEYWNNLKICLGIADGTFIEVKLPGAGPERSVAGSAKEPTNCNFESWRKSK